MRDDVHELLALALPRLRGHLARAWQRCGGGRLVIRHAIAGDRSGDLPIDRARVEGLPAVQPLSIEQIASGVTNLGAPGLEDLRFPACFFDKHSGLFVAAGDADDVDAWLHSVRTSGTATDRSTAREKPIGRVAGIATDGLTGKIVAVTGAASGIGLEIVRAFTAAGATVVGLDVNAQGLAALAGELGCLAMECDVTRQNAVDQAFGRIAAEVGGLDILVCNAGSASQAPIADVPMQELQKSFDLNFFGHQRVAQAAVRIFRLQGNGGLILFNISNQSVNPGKDFGPYGLAKAAELALMKQYALDHGHEGIRTNGVNAGRIRTGLMTDEMIEARATVRGLSAKDYMAGNLLSVEVTSKDVAQAFVHLALMEKVNAAVLTVDGGAMATSLR